jgi:hypothetical protein
MFINNELLQNKYSLFLRKVDPSFPDDILIDFIKPNPKKKSNAFMYHIIINTILIISFLCFFFLTFPSLTTINTSNKSSHWFIR